MSGFTRTPKQVEIMTHIVAATMRGQEITLVELHDKLSYGKTCTRAAVLCSIKFLEKHGMVTKEKRGPRSMYLTPTESGFERFKPRIVP